MEKNKNTAMKNELSEEFVEKVIKINRVNKVVKGGKRLTFRAFVISGNGNGEVSYAKGNSKEVPTAIKKAIDVCNKKRYKLNVETGTISHPVVGKFGASKVILRPARPGTGVIAGGPVRILLELAGYKDIVAKSLGSRNAINMTRAAFNGLLQCKDVVKEEKYRNKKLPIYIYKKHVIDSKELELEKQTDQKDNESDKGKEKDREKEKENKKQK